MSRTGLRLAVLAAFTLAAVAACAVRNPYDEAVLKTEIPDSPGSYVAGTDIRAGTWRFANTAPHPAGQRCTWTVAQPTGQRDTWVIIFASPDDTDNAVQSVYLAGGQRLDVAHCGKGGWLSADDQTWGPTPERSN